MFCVDLCLGWFNYGPFFGLGQPILIIFITSNSKLMKLISKDNIRLVYITR